MSEFFFSFPATEVPLIKKDLCIKKKNNLTQKKGFFCDGFFFVVRNNSGPLDSPFR